MGMGPMDMTWSGCARCALGYFRVKMFWQQPFEWVIHDLHPTTAMT